MTKGWFHLPAALEEDQDVERVEGQVSGQERLRVEFARHIPNEDKANRNRDQSGVIPDSLLGAYLNLAQLVVIPDDRQAYPAGGWGIDKLLGGWQALAFLTRTTCAAVGGAGSYKAASQRKRVITVTGLDSTWQACKKSSAA